MQRNLIILIYVGIISTIIGYTLTTKTHASTTLDEQLQTAIEAHALTPHTKPTTDPAQVQLGRLLFYDKILSGNRDISCATCHRTTNFGTGDGLPVSIGTGGNGISTERTLGHDRELVPRNATELFDRGAAEWTSMFWDSRLVQRPDQRFASPAHEQLPGGLDNILAAQAMFPVTSADEMRGRPGDRDVFGAVNEVGTIDANNFTGIWSKLMQRLLAIPEYRTLFASTYPDTAPQDLNFAHAANAIAAFEIDTFTFTNSPWDQYLRGDTTALLDEAKQGGILFYGKANCATCHSGNLFTDQQHYNIVVPQISPGKGDAAPLDLGRFGITRDENDRFAFRTPPLRNVTLSGPYMHNGTFVSLESAIRHHLEPEHSLRAYDVSEHLPLIFQSTFQNDPELLDDMLATLDSVAPTEELTESEIHAIATFLEALTDPAAMSLDVTPDTVPSGLLVSDEITQIYLPMAQMH
ncbi:MAG: cytochrome c peroxidase [Chloroflexota bacterium]